MKYEWTFFNNSISLWLSQDLFNGNVRFALIVAWMNSNSFFAVRMRAIWLVNCARCWFILYFVLFEIFQLDVNDECVIVCCWPIVFPILNPTLFIWFDWSAWSNFFQFGLGKTTKVKLNSIGLYIELISLCSWFCVLQFAMYTLPKLVAQFEDGPEQQVTEDYCSALEIWPIFSIVQTAIFIIMLNMINGD